jgi:copper resistance protein C
MSPAARVFAVALLCASASSAFAHAFLDRAVPAVGSTVHGAPTSIRVWFTQDIEPAFSTIKLQDAKGGELAAADKAVDPSDRSLMQLPVPPLRPGTYRVKWRVLSIDSHVTEGDFTFNVAP